MYKNGRMTRIWHGMCGRAQCFQGELAYRRRRSSTRRRRVRRTGAVLGGRSVLSGCWSKNTQQQRDAAPHEGVNAALKVRRFVSRLCRTCASAEHNILGLVGSATKLTVP